MVKIKIKNIRFFKLFFVFFYSYLEINTLTIFPSILSCACIKAAIKGLGMKHLHYIDELIEKKIHCDKYELNQTQRLIEQLFQTCLQDILPTPTRRCLAPIDTINKKNTTSPRVK